MLKKIGAEAGLSARREDIKQADKIILPGVGSFDYAVSNLEKLMLRDVLEERVRKEEIPILGICLGAQLMTAGSKNFAEGMRAFIEKRKPEYTPE